MSIIESLSSRWRRPVAEPQRHEPTTHVDILDRKPYDWSKDDEEFIVVNEPRACVVCKHGTTGRYLTDGDEIIPLCPRCHHGGPTEDDIANVIAAAERFMGGEGA